MQVVDDFMPQVFRPLFCDHWAMQISSHSNPSTPPLLVACLCADWCGACREYKPRFEQLQATFPGVQFVWVDVEDESDLVDPIEVENFPTLLMATRERVQFFGTVMPHLETLQRLIETQLAPGAPAQAPQPDHEALAKRLWGRIA
jgi:thiol-disulfide isomerase/thioredoxin